MLFYARVIVNMHIYIYGRFFFQVSSKDKETFEWIFRIIKVKKAILYKFYIKI